MRHASCATQLWYLAPPLPSHLTPQMPSTGLRLASLRLRPRLRRRSNGIRKPNPISSRDPGSLRPELARVHLPADTTIVEACCLL